MPFTLDWKGAEVREHVVEACVVGIDATLARAVLLSRADHPPYPPASKPGERYATRTNFLTLSTDITEPALSDGDRVSGRWGATADYALYVEIGTSRKESGFPRAQERAEEGEMWSIPPPSEPPQMAARPTLRVAQDDALPRLAARIGAAFRAEEVE